MDKHHDPVTSGTRREPKLAELTGEWAVGNAFASHRPFACEQFLIREWRRFREDTCRPKTTTIATTMAIRNACTTRSVAAKNTNRIGHFQTLPMLYNLQWLSIFDQGAVTTCRDNKSDTSACIVHWCWEAPQDNDPLVGAGTAILALLTPHLQWSPGATMPAAAFTTPELCTRATEVGLPPVGNELTGAAAFSCSDCHVTRR